MKISAKTITSLVESMRDLVGFQEKNQELCSKIKVFPIESLLANIISRLGTGESISELF